MHAKVPVLAVLGHSASGKTTVIESIVRGLTEKGYKVATAKHINQKGFSIDTTGKDTWRHSVAGANPVVSVSDVEIAILMKKEEERLSLDQLFRSMPEVDVIALEGFSRMVLDDEHVGKILCVKNRQEYKDYREKVKGEVIAFCSLQPMEDKILRITEDSAVYVKLALEFIERKIKVLKILGSLPRLDCKDCGLESCEEMAVAIYQGKAKFSDCIILKSKPKLKNRVTINDAEVPINPFVSEIIRNSILGMVSPLKGVSIKGDEKIHVKISS